jgi:hypothetical protein
VASEPVRLDRNLDAEALEIDNESKDNDGGNEVHNVGQAVAPERFAECSALVVPREEEVEERDNGALELGATAGVDGGGGEGFPNDGFADVGGDEEGYTRAEAVPFLEELIEENNDEGGDNELDYKRRQTPVPSSEGRP